MRSRYRTLFLLAGLASSSAARAANQYWINASGDNLWNNPANWSTNTVPTSSDWVILGYYYGSGSYPTGGPVDLGGGVVSASTVDVGYLRQTTPFIIQNGILEVTTVGGSLNSGNVISANLTAKSQPFGTRSLAVSSDSGYPLLVSGIIGGNGIASDNFDVLASATLTGANTYTGKTILTGQLTLGGPNGSIAASSSIELRAGTFLCIDNTTASNGNRIGDSAPISSTASTLQFAGNPTVASNETVGVLSLAGGTTVAQLYSYGGPTTLTFQGITQTPGATLAVSLWGAATAPAPRLVVNSAAALPLVGGGGANETSTMSILPYAIGSGAEFITYDRGSDGIVGTSDDAGLRPLSATEYSAVIPNGDASKANVKVAANQTMTLSTSVNALAISGATLTLGDGKRLTVTSGAVSFTGNSPGVTAVAGRGTLDFGTAAAYLYADGANLAPPPRYILAAPIAGTGSLTKYGPGAIVLTQTNPYSGDIYVTDGTLISQVQGALGAGALNVFADSGAAISIEQVDQVIPNHIGYARINVDAGLTATVTGMLDSGITKMGPGTLQLAGTTSATGRSQGVIVHEGLLQLRGNYASFTDIVGFGGVIAGGGTFPMATLRLNNAILHLGAGSATGANSMAVLGTDFIGGTVEVNINGTTPGTEFDQLITMNSPSMFQTNLAVDLGYAASVGDSYKIIDNQSANLTLATFNQLPEGATFWSGGDEFQITYQGGDGNDVVLTVVATPEPGTLGLLALPAAGLLLRRRGRNA